MIASGEEFLDGFDDIEGPIRQSRASIRGTLADGRSLVHLDLSCSQASATVHDVIKTLALMGCLLAAACQTTLRPATDYDPSVDLSPLVEQRLTSDTRATRISGLGSIQEKVSKVEKRSCALREIA